VNIMLRKSRANYNKELLRENSNDPEKFWKTLKSIYPVSSKKSVRSQSFEINGEKSSNETEIANGFKRFFSTVVQALKLKAMSMKDFIWSRPSIIDPRTYKTFQFKRVSPADVCRYLAKFQRKKASGCDNLHSTFLKDSRNAIKTPLCHIINLSLKCGIVPNAWKSARIVLVYKSGLRAAFDNYRPISILPIISKIIEKIVHKQLITFLEENKLT